MVSDRLPLLNIFHQLRQRGFPLGVDDYMTVLRSLQGGFGLSDRGELEQLCCMLWAKSVDDCRLIQGLFRQLWPPPEALKCLLQTTESPPVEPSEEPPLNQRYPV